MKAVEFNTIYDEVVVKPLVAAGFVQRDKNLFFFDASGVLALFRYRNKWSSFIQSTLLTVCIRHRFLRNLDKQPCDQFTKTIDDYPFKIQPTKFLLDFLKCGWHYTPCNLAHWPKDEIEFGKDNNARAKIENIRDIILAACPQWLKFLEPKEAYRQISQYGESAYCEKIWLEDYERHIEEK
jgi:hypothetical protein